MTISDRRQVMDPNEEAPPPPRRPDLSRYPPFSTALIVICVGAALYDWTHGGSPVNGVGGPLLGAGQLYGPYVTEGQWWRVLTNVLLHAGALHLGMNMFALWNVGRILEWAMGGPRLAAVTLITAIGASSFVLMFGYGFQTVGISGVLCGWIGALFAVATREGRQQLMTTIIQIAVISLLPFVSWQGHLGGFLFGLPLGLALRNGGKRFPIAAAALLVLALVACYAGARIGAERFVPVPDQQEETR